MFCIHMVQSRFKKHLWQFFSFLCLCCYGGLGHAAPEEPQSSQPLTSAGKPSAVSSSMRPEIKSKGTYHVSLKRSKRNMDLKLLFSQSMALRQRPPRAAVFVERPYLWIVLDHNISTHFSQKGQVKLPENFGAPERVSHPTHTVLRMKIPYNILPTINHDPEEGWSIIFGNDTKAPAGTYPTLASRIGASLVHPFSLIVQIPNSQATYLRSPEEGKLWVVIVEDEPGLGLPGIFRYADFTILKSLQGLVLAPISPDLTFVSQQNQIAISRPIGLRLSALNDRALAREKQEKKSLFNFKTWQQEDLPFAEAKSKLSNKIATAEEGDKLLTQLELAQFLIAHGNGAEAMGVLRTISAQNYRLKEDAEFMALLGAAHFLNGSYAKSLNIFSNPLFPPEAEIWRAGAMIALGLTHEGFLRLAKHKQILETYPDNLKSIFALKAIEGGLASKKQEKIQQFFNLIKDTPLTSGQENQLRDFQEAYADLLNPKASKDPLTDRRTKGKIAKNEAEKTFNEIQSRYQTKEFSFDETVHHLENLRHQWRGDFVEFLTLQMLARIQGDQRHFEKSMEAYERLFSYFPQHPQIPVLKKEAMEIYRQGLVALTPAFTKIAFFYRFKEFLPKTRERADILEKLANQLISLGLSDQAVTILEKERTQFVKTEPKYYIKLAQAYLEDNQPDKALNILSSPLLIQPKFKEKSHYLKAQAFYEKGEYKRALPFLQYSNNLESMALIADIYWAMKDWNHAAGQLQLMLKKNVSPQPELVIRLVMALYHDQQTEALGDMQRIYGRVMRDTPYENLFNMLTTSEQGIFDKEVINLTLRQIKDFQKFSKMLKSGKL